MNLINNILNDFLLIILDGVLVIEFENRGCDINDFFWFVKILVEKFEMIEKVYYDYFIVGVDCVIILSY